MFSPELMNVCHALVLLAKLWGHVPKTKRTQLKFEYLLVDTVLREMAAALETGRQLVKEAVLSGALSVDPEMGRRLQSLMERIDRLVGKA